jgi:hypothetical protein
MNITRQTRAVQQENNQDTKHRYTHIWHAVQNIERLSCPTSLLGKPFRFGLISTRTQWLAFFCRRPGKRKEEENKKVSLVSLFARGFGFGFRFGFGFGFGLGARTAENAANRTHPFEVASDDTILRDKCEHTKKSMTSNLGKGQAQDSSGGGRS